MRSKRILFIGDSLTEFFDWQRRFPGHEIVNLGSAGETVEGLLSRTDRLTKLTPAPDAVFLMTGINNVAIEDYDFLDSYGEIVEKISAAFPGVRLFIQSILPALVPWISGEAIRELNRSLQEIAEKAGKEYLDIYSLFIGPDGTGVRDYFLPDGVHLSDAGYTAWSKALERLLEV
jgi:lysophospholipase L1-like esterase